MNIIQRLILVTAAIAMGYMTAYPDGFLIYRVFGVIVISTMLVLASHKLELQTGFLCKQAVSRLFLMTSLCLVISIVVGVVISTFSFVTESIEAQNQKQVSSINQEGDYLSFDPRAGESIDRRYVFRK